MTVATLKKLAASGRIRPDEVTVAYHHGQRGYKTQEVIFDKVKKPVIIEPSIAQFREIYDKLSEESNASQSTHSRPTAKTH